MDHMHFESIWLPIYCMFWWSMEMKLVCIELYVWTQAGLWIARFKEFCFGCYFCVFNYNFYRVIWIPLDLCIINISISCLYIILKILSREWVAALRWSQINWSLNGSCTSWKVYWPIIAVLYVIISLSSCNIWNKRKNCCCQCYNHLRF
jgi:hypothetical protein